jgi:peptide-methionine (S)-S-oxide reductase
MSNHRFVRVASAVRNRRIGLIFSMSLLSISAVYSFQPGIFSRSLTNLNPGSQLIVRVREASRSRSVSERREASAVQNPAVADTSTQAKGKQTIVLAGGCFWGVEAVFERLKGVSNVVSGFSGGTAATANYEAVSHGSTNHAEAVQITYDPQQISLEQLLKVYFFVAHDPTQVNRQYPDVGTQYRSAIFFANSTQQKAAKSYIDKLDRSRTFSQPIATQVVPLTKFYAAEDYHQNFIVRHPQYPYVVIHDRPKLDQLQQQFPNLVRQ